MSWEPVCLNAVPSASWEADADARPVLGQSRQARAVQSSQGDATDVCACTRACKIRWFVPAVLHSSGCHRWSAVGYLSSSLTDVSAATSWFGLMGPGLENRSVFFTRTPGERWSWARPAFVALPHAPGGPGAPSLPPNAGRCSFLKGHRGPSCGLAFPTCVSDTFAPVNISPDLG